MAESTPPKPSSSVKLVLLGEAAVGKVRPSCASVSPFLEVMSDANLSLFQSSLVLRFVNNDFQENKEPTIGGTCILSLMRPGSL